MSYFKRENNDTDDIPHSPNTNNKAFSSNNSDCASSSNDDVFLFNSNDEQEDSNDNHTNDNFSYTSLNNDWDLDAAFLTSSHPYLSLKCQLISLRKNTRTTSMTDDWQVIHSHELTNKPQQHQIIPSKTASSSSTSSLNVMHLDPSGHSLIALWSSKATSVLQKQFTSIFGIGGGGSNKNINISRSGSINSVKSTASSTSPLLLHDDLKMEGGVGGGVEDEIFKQLIRKKKPLGDAELRNFLDSDGRVVQLHELRQRIFEGGCEASKRKELWPILLGVFPSNHLSVMTQKQRNEWLKVKAREYDMLKKSLWPTTYWVKIERFYSFFFK